MPEPRIGIDLGGVVTKLLGSMAGEDTGTLAWRTPGEAAELAIPGALAGVRELVELVDGRVWIVSKAGPVVQAKCREWFEAADFFGDTGMARAQVRFCLQRQDKAPICTALAITHFIDDRVHVMQILRAVVPHLFLFSESETDHHSAPWAIRTPTWPDVIAAVRRSLPQ
jgi:hypothetical protein